MADKEKEKEFYNLQQKLFKIDADRAWLLWDPKASAEEQVAQMRLELQKANKSNRWRLWK